MVLITMLVPQICTTNGRVRRRAFVVNGEIDESGAKQQKRREGAAHDGCACELVIPSRPCRREKSPVLSRTEGEKCQSKGSKTAYRVFVLLSTLRPFVLFRACCSCLCLTVQQR